jgi:hypothetical protein
MNQTTTAQPQIARLTGLLDFALKLAAVLVPVLYAMGRIYSEAYWSALGLPSSLMTYSVQDYLYFGFVSMFLWFARNIGIHPYGAIGYALLAALGIAVFALAVRFALWLISKTAPSWQTWLQERVHDRLPPRHGWVIGQFKSLASIAAIAALRLLFFIWVGFAAFVPIVFAVKAGQTQASADRLKDVAEPQSKAKTTSTAYAHYVLDDLPHSAPLLECSVDWCVVNDHGVVVALPKSTVVRVDQLANRD